MRSLWNFLLVLITSTAFAQQPLFSKTELKSVRVYTNGAELSHESVVNLPEGATELVLTNVANTLNESTIKIAAPKDVTVMSVQFSNAYIEEYDNNEQSPLIKPIREAIDQKQRKLDELNHEIETNKKAVELLDTNRQITSKDNFSVTLLEQLTKFYLSNRVSLLNTISTLEKEREVFKNELDALKEQLTFDDKTGKKSSKGKLILHLMNLKKGKTPIEVSYFTNQANWSPGYDLRIESIEQPIKTIYKASVRQNTGLDWQNIQLSLTSGFANRNTHLPQLSPFYVDYEELYTYNDKVVSRSKSTNELMLATADAVEGMALAESTLGAEADVSQLNLTYNIDIPYTILSNNKMHSVNLKEVEIPATYEYVVVPKYDNSVYLTASIKDYQKLNLLSGSAQIIFDNVYVGTTYIDTQNTEETLLLSLGIDSNISVKRTLKNEKEGSKVFSSKKTNIFSYEIEVKNNKNKPVKVKVLDQVPISANKDIQISVLDKDNGTLNEKDGTVTWIVNLKPGENEILHLKYQIKSDETKNLNL